MSVKSAKGGNGRPSYTCEGRRRRGSGHSIKPHARLGCRPASGSHCGPTVRSIRVRQPLGLCKPTEARAGEREKNEKLDSQFPGPRVTGVRGRTRKPVHRQPTPSITMYHRQYLHNVCNTSLQLILCTNVRLGQNYLKLNVNNLHTDSSRPGAGKLTDIRIECSAVVCLCCLSRGRSFTPCTVYFMAQWQNPCDTKPGLCCPSLCSQLEPRTYTARCKAAVLRNHGNL